MPIDIVTASQIDGWMQLEELTWLAEQASTHRVIVEIGSYLGRSTRALADHTPGQVLAVDDWKGPRGVTLTKTPHQLYKEFTQNLSDLIKSGKVTPLKTDYNEIGDIDLEPDMVFIDGDHEYPSVKRDIEFWLPKMVSGGLICGHDCSYPGVAQAIKEAFSSFSYAPSSSIWYTYKK